MQATRRRVIIDRHRGAEKARPEEARCEAAGRDDGKRTEGRDASEARERIDDIDSLLKGVLAWLFGCRRIFDASAGQCYGASISRVAAVASAASSSAAPAARRLR
jgi:hypothetical protein